MPRNATLDALDHRLIAVLLSGCTQEEAASQLGRHRKTLWRRQQRPEFARALHEVTDEARRAQLRHLSRSAAAASRCLLSVVEDDGADTRDRIGAARVLLDKWALLQPHRLDAHVAVAAPAPVVASESWADVIDAYAAKIATAYGTVGGEEIHPNGDKETA